ncbi:pentapeptide repeat-containing protein [Alphaproteobacteria bacterium]|nr:pentapeptide repeat-containing protein [Alphaproteobacteria bacterium]
MNDVVEKGMKFYQRWARVIWGVISLIIIFVLIYFAYCFWGWLSDGGGESNSAVLRNISFMVAGIIGLTLAGWRSLIAQKQAETSESGLQNDRYQKGAEMLGNETCSTRLGGIYALERLARDHPKTYHEQIMELLSSFARHPTTDTAIEIEYYNKATSKETYHVRPDVYEAVSAILRCKVAQIKNENGSGKNSGSYQTNLSVRYLRSEGPPYINLTNVKLTGADLSYVDLSGAELNGADLSDADLSDAHLIGAKLFGAKLIDTKLPGANLTNVNLTNVNLTGAYFAYACLAGASLLNVNLSNADLSDADFSDVVWLTQEQLDKAGQHPDGKPPNLPNWLYWDEDAAKKRYEVYWTPKS